MDFINKLFEKRIGEDKDAESIHKQFTRFGKGSYGGKALINLQRGKQIKVSSSFEYGPDFIDLICQLAGESDNKPNNLEVNGIILSKEKIENPNLKNEKLKSGKYNYDIAGEISAQELTNINQQCYNILAEIKTKDNGIELKSKKKLPKPGKSENKVDDKFFVLKADLKYWPKIRPELFPSLSDSVKKAKIRHTIIIDSIISPADMQGEKDFAKIRELAKRKGKIIRDSEIDKNPQKDEVEFEV